MVFFVRVYWRCKHGMVVYLADELLLSIVERRSNTVSTR